MSDQEKPRIAASTDTAGNEQPSGLANFEVAFPPGPAGSTSPNGNVILDGSGDVFGTTQAGGNSNSGTVFEAADNPSGGVYTPVTLTSFSNYTATAHEPGNLIMDSSGDLLGTTFSGGTTSSDDGTIFELAKTPSGYSSTPNVLVSFKQGALAAPEDLTTDAKGDLFGATATARGGKPGATVFELAKTKQGYQTHVHVLTSFKSGAPVPDSPREQISSNLLVTPSGLIGAITGGRAGAGQVFELKATPRGTYQQKPTILASNLSVQNLATDSTGDIFAVSSFGGTNHEGAIYELGPKGSTTDILNFAGANGDQPTGITIDGAGNIYGTTVSGGTSNQGTVFEVAKTSTGYVQDHTMSFTGDSGSFLGRNPVGSPTLNGGFLYGTTTGGGASGYLYGLNTADIGGAAASVSDARVDPIGPAAAGSLVAGDAAAQPAVCFAAGTCIRVMRNGRRADIAVEDLRVGDLAITASGAARPICWLGHRTMDLRRLPRPQDAMPVRVAADAFGENRPACDLLVSPGHAICVDAVGDVLIPAGALINGTTITQLEVDRVTYWHVELDSHDVIFAGNLPCESYLDMGNRGFFAEGAIVALAASPDAPPVRHTHADFCRPYVFDGPRLEAVKARLGARAATVSGERFNTGSAASAR